MECGICLEAMAVPSYLADAQAETLDHGHSRFACGHAFHAACAVQALLSGAPRCPSCRANLDPSRLAWEDADTPVLIRTDLEVDLSMSSDPTMRRVRSRYSEVQVLRRALRQRVTTYNRLQDRMRHLRRAAIQEALGAFRRRHYEACSAAIEGVQAALLDVVDSERKAWQIETGAAPSGVAWEVYAQQAAPDVVGQPRTRTESLLDRRFWSLR